MEPAILITPDTRSFFSVESAQPVTAALAAVDLQPFLHQSIHEVEAALDGVANVYIDDPNQTAHHWVPDRQSLLAVVHRGVFHRGFLGVRPIQFQSNVLAVEGGSGETLVTPSEEGDVHQTLYVRGGGGAVLVFPRTSFFYRRVVLYASPRWTVQWRFEDEQELHPWLFGESVEISPAGQVVHWRPTLHLNGQTYRNVLVNMNLPVFYTKAPWVVPIDWQQPPGLIAEFVHIHDSRVLWYFVAVPTMNRKRNRNEVAKSTPEWLEIQRHWKECVDWIYPVLMNSRNHEKLYTTFREEESLVALRMNFHTLLSWMYFVGELDPFIMGSWWSRGLHLSEKNNHFPPGPLEVTETTQWTPITDWVQEHYLRLEDIMSFLATSVVLTGGEPMLKALLEAESHTIRFRWAETLAGDLLDWSFQPEYECKHQLIQKFESWVQEGLSPITPSMTVTQWKRATVIQMSPVLGEIVHTIIHQLNHILQSKFPANALFRLVKIRESSHSRAIPHVMPSKLMTIEHQCARDLWFLYHQPPSLDPPLGDDAFWKQWIALGGHAPNPEQAAWLPELLGATQLRMKEAGIISCLEGPPGCGKSSMGVRGWLMSWMLKHNIHNDQVILLAPTGAAFTELAKGMRMESYLKSLSYQERNERFLADRTTLPPKDGSIRTMLDISKEVYGCERSEPHPFWKATLTSGRRTFLESSGWHEIVKRRWAQFTDQPLELMKEHYSLYNTALSGTIHRFLLYANRAMTFNGVEQLMQKYDPKHTKRPTNPATATQQAMLSIARLLAEKRPLFVVIDEMSMVDMTMMASTMRVLRKFVQMGLPLGNMLFCGDARQLPSIRYGAVFLNMIQDFPRVARYTQRMRQQGSSGTAALIDSMIHTMDSGGTFQFEPREDQEYRCVSYCALAQQQSGLFQPDSVRRCAILADMLQYESENGKFAIVVAYENKYLTNWNLYGQQRWVATFKEWTKTRYDSEPELFHVTKLTKETVIYPLDRIVRMKNALKHMQLFANGDAGMVIWKRRDTSRRSFEFCILYFRGVVEWVSEDVLRSEFALAYALTTHKMQGSTVDRVIHLEDMTRRDKMGLLQLPYVADSRAKAGLTVVVFDQSDSPLRYQYSMDISFFFNEVPHQHTFVDFDGFVPLFQQKIIT